MYSYNAADQLTTISSTRNGDTLALFSYTVDGLGRRTSATEQLRTSAGTTATYGVSYSYDQLSRLLSETRTKDGATLVSDVYEYDKVGNRVSKNGQSYTYDADKLTLDAENNPYTYDANGNQLTKAGWTYEYDWDHQLTRATAPDGTIIEFWYDTQGHRLRKAVTVGGTTTTTNYVVDAELPYAQVLLETDGAHQVTAKYTYADDLLKVSRNGEYYYFTDGLGSTRLLTDATGAVVNRYTYDAYGTQLPTECEATVANEYRFTGERTDADTGLVYLRARYYDPTTGRFVQRDSYTGSTYDPASLHRYGYCHGNPVNGTDPSGHFFGSVADTMVASAVRNTLAGIQDLAGTIILDSLREGKLKMDAALWVAGGAVAGAIIAKYGPRIAEFASERIYKASDWIAERASGVFGKMQRHWDEVFDWIKGGKDACFITGTLVATQHGMLPIEQITTDHLVWAFRHDSDPAPYTIDVVAATRDTPAAAFVAQPYTGEARRPAATDVVGVLDATLALHHTAVLATVEPGRSILYDGLAYRVQAGEDGALTLRETGLMLARVTQTFRHTGQDGADRLIDVTMGTDDGELHLLQATPNHPFYVPDQQAYVELGQLTPGTRVQTADHGMATIQTMTVNEGLFDVYNLEVEGPHNYFVGDVRVLVHNKSAFIGSIRARLRVAGLPGGSSKSGPFRFRPKENYHSSNELPKGPNGGFMDRFGNEWVKGPYHGDRSKGFTFEWDVQLTKRGQNAWGTKEPYINVRPDGFKSH